MPGKPRKRKDSFDNNHRVMLRRRGLDPANYELVKETYGSVYLRDKRDGSIKIINKQN